MSRMTSPQPKQKAGQESNPPVIVQFFHSGKEFAVSGIRNGNPVEVPWSVARRVERKKLRSKGCANQPKRTKEGGCGGCVNEDDWTADHFRRLVVHKGEYIGMDGKLVSDELAFWTEWEACTTASAMVKGDEETDARWFHHVATPLGKTGDHRINTDPCVFGSSFKYSLCMQHKENEKNDGLLRRLPPGSIILFGSRFLKRGEFVLDTVFVVGNVIVPYRENTKKKLAVSEKYRQLTLNRFSNDVDENTFYRGAPFRSRGGAKPYSFVPAKTFVPGDPRCGKRFVLDLAAVNKRLQGASDQFDPESGQTQGFHAIEGSPEIIWSVWNEILRQVYHEHFVPGVHFGWPK